MIIFFLRLVRENVQTVLNANKEVLKSMQDTQELIDDYTAGIAERLKPKLYELKREGDSKISLASEKCKIYFLFSIQCRMNAYLTLDLPTSQDY